MPIPSRCYVSFLILTASLSLNARAQNVPDGLPAPPVRPSIRNAQLEAALGKIRRAKIYAAYREAIAIYKAAGLYDEAAKLHREQVPLYRAQKLDDAAIIQANEAFALESQLRFFYQTTTTAQGAGALYTDARNEPVSGAYLGAFIDRDEALGEAFLDENFQSHRTPAQFLNATGRHPGTLFMYMAYGRPVPLKWLQTLKEQGTIPIISWEPKSLNAVRDDEYLKNFALELAKLDWPVFIRFASEMNGKWTPWHGNPTLYKQKFQLVHRVMHQHAPRVATMWVINNPPIGNALDYYPGDEFCDWVGVNFYAVPYFENNLKRPGFSANPLGLLDVVYQQFSARKPIAIAEFAASCRAGVDGKPIPDFAVEKTRVIYESLPLLYPRVKMINWFNMDTIKARIPGKTWNDYRLTACPPLLQAWQKATDSPYFLEWRERLADPIAPVFKQLNGQKITEKTSIRVWSKSFGLGSQVFVALDGKIIQRSKGSGALSFEIDPLTLESGNHTLTAYLYDAKNRFQRQTSVNFSKP